MASSITRIQTPPDEPVKDCILVPERVCLSRFQYGMERMTESAEMTYWPHLSSQPCVCTCASAKAAERRRKRRKTATHLLHPTATLRMQFQRCETCLPPASAGEIGNKTLRHNR